MQLGLAYFPTEYAMPVAQLAVSVEERGFESLLFAEHTHIPASRQTPYPWGAELPREYSHTLDPFVALGVAAAVTRRLLVGTGICLVTERDPIALAKAVASVDQVSGGRMLFGVGAGWNVEEMRNHGADPARRWTLTGERMRAMRRIWTEDEAEFHGRYVDFDPLWSWPKPVRPGGPPVLVGGGGPRALDRVLDYGDGWFPVYGEVRADLADRVGELRRRGAEAGRTDLSVTVGWVPPKRDRLERLADAGADRAVLALPSAPGDDLLPLLDRYATLL